MREHVDQLIDALAGYVFVDAQDGVSDPTYYQAVHQKISAIVNDPAGLCENLDRSLKSAVIGKAREIAEDILKGKL